MRVRLKIILCLKGQRLENMIIGGISQRQRNPPILSSFDLITVIILGEECKL
jgi:hypothetical protein